MMHEWPLIIFSLLIQASVGVTLATTLFNFARGQTSPASGFSVLMTCLCLAFIAGGTGVIVSMMHLGYPLNALHTLRHLASSWLSREILLVSLYLASLGLVILLAIIKKRFCQKLLLITAAFGIIDVFCMAAIYAHASVITWMHINTYVMFYGTVVMLAALTGITIAVSQPNLFALSMKKIAILSLIVMGLMLVVRFSVQQSYLTMLTQQDLNQVVTFPYHPVESFMQLNGLRMLSWILAIIGICFLIMTIYAKQPNKIKLVIGGACVFGAEILFRFLFFSIS